MREHPLICADSVVRNILSGAQTQDRRPVTTGTCNYNGAPASKKVWACLRFGEGELRREPAGPGTYLSVPLSPPYGDEGVRYRVRPRIEAGDLLYCRETLRRADDDPCGEPIVTYAADGAAAMDMWTPIRWPWERPVRPSIHMDRLFARLWLRVEWVRLERLQDIDEDGCKAEGCADWRAFADLWNGLYASKGMAWKTNPWVVACGFSVASRSGWAGV